MTFATQDGPTDLWLEWNLVVLSAVVANDLEALGCVFALASSLRATLRATLRRHHVALIEDLLLLFGEKEGFFTLNARGLDVRHSLSPYCEYEKVN